MSDAPTIPAWKQDFSLNSRVRAQGFAGAKRDEWSSQWQTNLQDPDDTLGSDLQKLWERSEDLHRNSSIIQGATETLIRGVIGRGVKAISRATVGNPEIDETLRKTLQKYWMEWCRTAGAEGTTTFADKTRQAIKLMAMHGDTLAIWPQTGDGVVGLQVDLVAAPRVETPPNAGESVRMGVVYRGRKIDGYTVRKKAVGRANGENDYYRWSRKRMGVWSSNLLARPFCVSPNQSRAYPLITSAIRTIKDFETYLQAELRRSIVSSKLAGVIQAPDPTVIEKAFSNVTTMPSGADYQKSYMGRSFGTLFDAQIMSLATGESMQLFSPNNTNSGLAAYVETVLRVIANAYGLPHSIAFSLYSDINFSNARTQILQARRTFDIWREALVDGFCRPTWEMFVTQLWAAGKLPMVREVTPEILACEWRADLEPWVDPLKEVKANTEAIANLMASHESVAAERGEDAREIALQEMDFVAWKKKEMALRGLEDSDLGYIPTESKSESESESTSKTETSNDSKKKESPDE